MTRKRLVVVGLVVLAALAGVLGYQAYLDHEEFKQAQRNRLRTDEIMRQVRAEKAASERLPSADKDMARLPTTMPRAVSAWRTAEKAFYEQILAKGRFDTLVVPFQVQDHAFARNMRSLMTADLAMAMVQASGGKLSVPDPYLVARALGDGERRVELEQIFRIANVLNVSRVVVGYVGHEKGHMRVTLHQYEKTGGERLGFGQQHMHRPGKLVSMRMVPSDRLNSRHFERLAFTEVDTPLDVFHRQIPAMLDFLGVKGAAAAGVTSRLDSAALPAAPLAMASAAPELARDAYYLQLLAALTPRSGERVGERFVEKSMLAVLQMSPESPDYRVLKARALMNLGLRPAALQALGTPSSAEEKHLFALLNGNLPDVVAARRQIAPGLRAVIAALEENAIAASYGTRNQQASLAEVAPLKLPGEVWPFLVARAVSDADVWAQHENLLVKALLDREFPMEGTTAQGLVQGAAAVGDPRQLQTAADLSVLDHVRKQTERSAQKWCCEPLLARPTALDYLDLLESFGTDNLVRRARFINDTQGMPQDALQYLARLESAFKDHPQFALARADAQMDLAKTAQGAEQEGLRRSSYATAFNVWYWEQGQTRTAAAAHDDIIQRLVRTDFGGFDNFYANDYPYRPFYPYWQLGAEDAWLHNARAALANSAFDFTPVDQLEWSLVQVKKQWDAFDQILASIEGRFAGHPRRVVMMAQSSWRKGDLQASETYYREGIRRQPNDSDLYKNLGKLLLENGAVDKSAEVFMSYPGLKNPAGLNPVGLANYAYDAGSLYFWSGEFKRALQLYRVSAQLQTGSASSIASATRLRLLEGDLAGAVVGSLERARRYNSAFAYRDYFGLLHAMGHSKQAWDGFGVVMQIDAPQIWETALVGHQRDGASEAQITKWVSQEPMLAAGVRYQYAVLYMLRAAVTDRIPSAELPAQIEAIERPVLQLDNQWRSVVRKPASGMEYIALGPRGPSEGTLRLPYDNTKRTRVKSELVYFAEAYRALRLGRFGEARALFEEASALYDMRNEFLGYLLPYYAFAAARANDTAAVEALLAKFDAEYQRLDYHLAKAILSGLAGKTGESMQHLKLALYRRPFTEKRPVLTEYQFAEICEWLFDATRQPAYRNAALDWAKKNQVTQPWFAWSYAVEARLATNPADRSRAMAMAYYLDRNSERLARLPKAEVQQAVKEYRGRNPFLTEERSKGRA